MPLLLHNIQCIILNLIGKRKHSVICFNIISNIEIIIIRFFHIQIQIPKIDIHDEVRFHDPVLALDGREDGLYFYRRITEQAGSYLKPGGWLMYEIGCEQGADVSAIMRQNGFVDVAVKKDLAGLDRVVIGKKQMQEEQHV